MAETAFINPKGMHDPSRIYTHVAVAPPGRTVYLAGQYGAASDGSVVSPAFADQVAEAHANVRRALDAAGADAAQVTKITHYVVALDADRRATLQAAVAKMWPARKPPSTLLGVARLARPDMLYEIDVVAVIPD